MCVYRGRRGIIPRRRRVRRRAPLPSGTRDPRGARPCPLSKLCGGGLYKTASAPTRLSYHDGNNYNAVIGPLVPTASPPLTASLMILLLRIDASSAEAKAFPPAFRHSPPSGFSARSGGGGEGGLQRFPGGSGNVTTVIFGASSFAASSSGAPSFGTSSEVTSLFV